MKANTPTITFVTVMSFLALAGIADFVTRTPKLSLLVDQDNGCDIKKIVIDADQEILDEFCPNPIRKNITVLGTRVDTQYVFSGNVYVYTTNGVVRSYQYTEKNK